MSDKGSVPAVKRGGRKATALTAQKAEAKKRPRKEVKPVGSGDEDSAKPPKRGKGSPKSANKKKAALKAKSFPADRRGRSKKNEKSKHSEEDKNKNENDDD